MTQAQLIKKIRNNKHITIFAELCGVHVNLIRAAERGEYVEPHVLQAVADYADMSMDELLAQIDESSRINLQPIPQVTLREELIRLQADMHILDFSAISGISKTSISNIQNGHRVTNATLKKLAKFAGEDFDQWKRKVQLP